MILPKLIAITDCTITSQELLVERAKILCASCAPGTVMLQLRDRQLGFRSRLLLGRQLFDLAKRHGQYLCVNDRLDLAMALDAHALHLGERSVPARDVRALVGARFWISRAIHDQSRVAADEVDALLLSPICEARKGAQARGVDAITIAHATGSTPVYALGGVNAENAIACLTAGATGVAAIGAWLTSASVQPLVGALGIHRVC